MKPIKGAHQVHAPTPHPQYIPPPWPAFKAAIKPATQSPWSTTLWLWPKGHPSCVRIIVEGADESLVNRYAELITQSVNGILKPEPEPPRDEPVDQSTPSAMLAGLSFSTVFALKHAEKGELKTTFAGPDMNGKYSGFIITADGRPLVSTGQTFDFASAAKSFVEDVIAKAKEFDFAKASKE